MIVDPAVIPGLLLLGAELAVLAGLGYVVVRVALRQDDELSALAQGLVVGPALWGIVVNFVMYAVPGLTGAAVGWVLMLGLAGGLAWRSPGRLPVSARVLAKFVGAVAVLGYAALASRQLLSISDPQITLGLAASIRAGTFPVATPWHPEATGVYHYGASLLTGLLAPPAGPDLAFVWELVGAYAWVSFALVIATALRLRGSWPTTLVLAPLLLSYGLHTAVWDNPDVTVRILRLPVPTGWPAAGLRTALADIYWAPVEHLGWLPNLWRPPFPMGYGVMFVVIAHAARSESPTWLGSLTLAGLVGFLSLLVTTLTPVVATLWAGLEIVRLIRPRRASSAMLAAGLRSGTGLALGGLLLLTGGGALSGVVGGGASTGLTWGAGIDDKHWPVVGSVETLAGGVGVLSLGPLAVAGLAAVLARRDRLVLALAAGAGLLSLVWLALDYPVRPQDLHRFAGLARNLAVLALLVALSARLAEVQIPRRRYAVGALLVCLVIWPTIAAPAKSAGVALSHGIQLANADRAWRAALAQDDSAAPRRYRMPSISDRVAAGIRDHTETDARVLDPTPGLSVPLNTGRPTNSGFVGVVQLSRRQGPEYLDARHYLEPAAFRRLGLGYVYAPAGWIATLPAQAQGWLADRRMFDLLVRDGDEALYRVLPAFLALDTSPHPESFEALRAAVPPIPTVYLPGHLQSDYWTQVRLLAVASALPQARLVGTLRPERLHLWTAAPWQIEDLGGNGPDLVALPLLPEAWVYPPADWREVWRNSRERIVVYAPNSAAAPQADSEPPVVRVRLANIHTSEARLEFTATIEADALVEWSGQDWVLGPTDASSLGIPALSQEGGLQDSQWFAGQAAAGAPTTTRTYVFDASVSRLAVHTAGDAYATVQSSAREPAEGAWMLALRLTRPGDSGLPDIAAIVPVLRFAVAPDGTVSSPQIYEASDGWRPS